MSTLADVDDIGVLKHFFHRFAVNLHDIPHPLVAGNVVEDSPVFVLVRILIAYLVDSNFGLLLFETENGSRAILGMDAIKITIFDTVEDCIKMTFLHINIKDFFYRSAIIHKEESATETFSVFVSALFRAASR